MLLHNNTIATAGFLSTTESPSSTTSVYSHQTNLPTTSTNQYFQNFPPPWIQQYNNQRLFNQQFFVREIMSDDDNDDGGDGKIV
ncbi:unnamed protein product [Rotaria sp. Silwood1]|nr:unnamed protein product [Rotaria sp. Silwood1]CAF1353327.1 unnamed protein product [Rotaria sp. Silwood1]CAF1355778.1 unnamed protein product [Rotaria sp. Silwood1]CAF3514509.1 unnamed protein product [Rotaria sp. Silwood1]CAF3550549.1 unnamed protein product [Rotaria sp. Silwood1]